MYANLHIEKMAFKVVQIKSLAMHITNKKGQVLRCLWYDIFKISSWYMILIS